MVKYDEMKKNTHQSIIDAFKQGIAIAVDPANDLAIQSSDEVVTTLDSHWLGEFCQVCSHSFRLGDEVMISNDGTVCHNSDLLPCSRKKRISNESSHEMSAFFDGLNESWPPPKNIQVVRLEHDHPLLAPPKAGFKRYVCTVCGHTLRLHDHVIICPCSPDKPKCMTAIHRDPIHGLHCFEAWNPGANKQEFCPVTSRKLNE